MGYHSVLSGLALSSPKVLSRFSSTASAALREALGKQLEAMKAAGTWKVERVITSPQAATITVQDHKGEVLNFCANNYLGLSVSACAHVGMAMAIYSQFLPMLCSLILRL